jgi:hypothetical protein
MKYPRIIVIVFTALVFYGCSKHTGLPGYIKDLEIQYSNDVAVGKPVHFWSTAPAGSTYYWTFGTGETATTDSPYYTFLVPRPFTVSLKINDTGTPVTKTIFISIGQDILTQMTGSRNWTVHFTSHNPSATPVDSDTVFNWAGRVFDINNDTSLTPLPTGAKLSYIYPGTFLPAGRYVMFGNGTLNDPTNSWSSAYYEYSEDSMSYIKYTNFSNGFEKYEYTSPH